MRGQDGKQGKGGKGAAGIEVKTTDKMSKRRREALLWQNGDLSPVRLNGRVEDGWFKIELPFVVVEHLGTTEYVGLVCLPNGTVVLDPIQKHNGHYREAVEIARHGEAAVAGSGGAGAADDDGKGVVGAGGGSAAVRAGDKDGADGGKGNPAL